MKEVVAGLDIGTSSIKLLLYSQNKVIYSDRTEHLKDAPDGREIDPVVLVEQIIHLIRRARSKNKHLRIKAIGLSTLFPSFIALDGKGKPLTKIMTWMDNRGAEMVDQFKTDKKKSKRMQKKTGCVPHASHPVWKVLWLKRYKRDLYSKASKFLSLSDYLVYRLTGKFAVSYAIASTTGLFNINYLKWDQEILAMAGITEQQLSKCHSIFHSENILEEIRIKMGIEHDVPLVLGAGDGHLSCIGSGCLNGKAVCSTIGTSAALRIVGGPREHSSPVWEYYLCKKNYIYGIAINAGASTLSWFYENIFHKDPGNLFNDIDGLDSVRPTGIIVLPYFDGERGPYYNQKRSASISGLNSGSTDVDIYKAAIEGILFNLYHCYEILMAGRKGPGEVVATGGYINSNTMLQMQSDIFNTKIKVPYVKEASAMGAALVSLVAIGGLPSLSGIKFKYEKIYLPDPKKHAQYMRKYKEYRKLHKIYYDD